MNLRPVDRRVVAPDRATEELRKLSKPCKDQKAIAQVGTISANRDEAICKTITGTVEAIGLRSITLRSDDGAVHFVPASEIRIVTNRSYGHVYALLEAGAQPPTLRRVAMSWAWLKRVFGIEIDRCQRCGPRRDAGQGPRQR